MRSKPKAGSPMAIDQPSLPYGNPPTQGWSGSDTSRERAERDAASGTANERQQFVLAGLDTPEYRLWGITVKELREKTGWHHGVASSVLSVLHKDGRLARLTERRDRCAIYVLPQYADDRETAPHHANKRVTAEEYDEAVALVAALTNALASDRLMRGLYGNTIRQAEEFLDR